MNHLYDVLATLLEYPGEDWSERVERCKRWLTIQEPEPGALPDPSPNDDEHHRLPDGTTLHIYVWMHRYGGQVPAAFVPLPQNSGWIEVFSAPPNPVAPRRSRV